MGSHHSINNAFYDSLGEAWYDAQNHPVALLRAENQLRAPWMLQEINKRCGPTPQMILDVGCGAGFLANALAGGGHLVTGVDLSLESLRVATTCDSTRSVRYVQANAYHMPFSSSSFDVIAAMDLLEHVEDPGQVLQETSRLLKPGGLFFFHTFNRNVLSYLLVIKGVEWFVANTPQNMHVYALFLKPHELKTMCLQHHMRVILMRGFVPKLCSKALCKMIWTHHVPKEFAFRFSKNKMTGYCGIAEKL